MFISIFQLFNKLLGTSCQCYDRPIKSVLCSAATSVQQRNADVRVWGGDVVRGRVGNRGYTAITTVAMETLPSAPGLIKNQPLEKHSQIKLYFGSTDPTCVHCELCCSPRLSSHMVCFMCGYILPLVSDKQRQVYFLPLIRVFDSKV